MKRIYCRFNGEQVILEENYGREKATLFSGDILELEMFLIFETKEQFTFYDTQTLVNGDDLLIECRRRRVKMSEGANGTPIVLSNAPRSSATPRVYSRSVD